MWENNAKEIDVGVCGIIIIIIIIIIEQLLME
jgi:hypothetical protein